MTDFQKRLAELRDLAEGYADGSPQVSTLLAMRILALLPVVEASIAHRNDGPRALHAIYDALDECERQLTKG